MSARRTARRTHAQVAADAVARERADAVAYARAHLTGIAALIERGRVSAEAAGLLQDRIESFIEMIEQGLHAGASDKGNQNGQ